MDDDAAERERQAIVTRLMPKTQASGALSGPGLPSLVDHYWGKVLALFEAIDRPLSGERLTQFHDLFRRTIEQGFEASPYAKFILEYSPAGPQGAEIQCELSLAAPTLHQEFQRWATGSVPANELFGKHPIHASAHITGGGLTENIIRVIPDGLGLDIEASAIVLPPVFDWLQREGAVPREEMWRTFNCGVGFVLVLAPGDVAAVSASLDGFGLAHRPIGAVVPRTDGERVRFVG